MKVKEMYFKKYGVDMQSAAEEAYKVAAKCKSVNVYTTATEKLGEILIEKYDIFNTVFKVLYNQSVESVEKITDKKRQRMGIDYVVNNKKIDIKVCCGPDYKCCPIEITQYSQVSYKNKSTDLLLYILCDLKGIRVCVLDFNEYKRIVDDVILNQSAKYEINTSFNGTGTYVKYFIRSILNIQESVKCC